ncbi:hypothetical protein B0T26DRAFT_740676 [Lasiosphaeria miniovina]|uniref:Cytochrome b mRNA-processing protein 4 n=1 Tax=Lasiosphaeria miniovina TaxID=1954250 RepID=A0AA40AJR1_9PEZI|nr:uncharacterized protein B0T26DRAFT_740676 [Lasiosphaeria miniovina]KAK0717151.1 hypothetical protein B0T26DRAFT_740676 [Lasiosphaeria miniovina]
MPKKPFNWRLWTKMIVGGGAICVGGPAFTYWVMPTDEELFKKYNPELQKKSLERRDERQQEFDDFVTRLKQASKSDKPIWVVQAEHIKQAQDKHKEEQSRMQKEIEARREEMRREAGLQQQPSSPPNCR